MELSMTKGAVLRRAYDAGLEQALAANKEPEVAKELARKAYREAAANYVPPVLINLGDVD